ncbi:MAG: transposase, partial [Clostridia bacterium]
MKSIVKSPAEWQAIVTEKEREIAELRQRVEWLTEQFRLMQARQFGVSSEKTMPSPDQLSLFNEAEATADPTVPEPEIEQIT